MPYKAGSQYQDAVPPTDMSFLESAPADVIREIGYLGASSVLDCQDILSLLLTSSRLYRTLNIHNCPSVYAAAFRVTYGSPGGPVASTFLAAELVRRCNLLRRLRKDDMTCDGRLKEDLRTAVCMRGEINDDTDKRLADLNLPRFVWKLWQTTCVSETADLEIKGLLLILLSMTVSYEDLCNATFRDQLTNSLAPYVLLMVREQVARDAPPNEGENTLDVSPAADGVYRPDGTCHALEPIALPSLLFFTGGYALSPAHAVLQLYCAAQLRQLEAPPYLPLTRASAVQHNRGGPTQEDCLAFSALRMPLFADAHDRARADAHSAPAAPLAPGALTGVWEGFYMVAYESLQLDEEALATSVPQDFGARRPLQCALTEYLSDDSEHTLSGLDPQTMEPTQLSLRRITKVEGGFERGGVRYAYTIIRPDAPQPRGGAHWLVTGTTEREHTEAWGEYVYSGDVQDDGRVHLIRQPVEESGEGEWLFSGRVVPGGALVGCFRVLHGAGGGVRGVFSMRKRA